MTLGEKIHRLRAANKMTQAEFADACGVSVQAVQKWECDSYAPFAREADAAFATVQYFARRACAR